MGRGGGVSEVETDARSRESSSSSSSGARMGFSGDWRLERNRGILNIFGSPWGQPWMNGFLTHGSVPALSDAASV